MHATSDAAFRLPLDVRPLGYDATLSVDLEGRRFSGTLSLSLQLGAAAEKGQHSIRLQREQVLEFQILRML